MAARGASSNTSAVAGVHRSGQQMPLTFRAATSDSRPTCDSMVRPQPFPFASATQFMPDKRQGPGSRRGADQRARARGALTPAAPCLSTSAPASAPARQV
jgi:hypothetical protein